MSEFDEMHEKRQREEYLIETRAMMLQAIERAQGGGQCQYWDGPIDCQPEWNPADTKPMCVVGQYIKLKDENLWVKLVKSGLQRTAVGQLDFVVEVLPEHEVLLLARLQSIWDGITDWEDSYAVGEGKARDKMIAEVEQWMQGMSNYGWDEVET